MFWLLEIVSLLLIIINNDSIIFLFQYTFLTSLTASTRQNRLGIVGNIANFRWYLFILNFKFEFEGEELITYLFGC